MGVQEYDETCTEKQVNLWVYKTNSVKLSGVITAVAL